MTPDDVKVILKLVTRYASHVSAADCAAGAGYGTSQSAEERRAETAWHELVTRLNSLVQQ